MSPTEKRTTHFGYQEVPVDEKASRVADVFHSVAARYDVMNDLMSMGIHRIWKRLTIERAGVRPGHHVLDIAGGTGDLTLKFSRLVGPRGKVVLADINASMLRVGRDKLMDNGVGGNVEYVQANAECLPFPDNSFDCITIAFGLRNVTDKDAALRSMARVLKPGGRLLVLEFSTPTRRLFAWVYRVYFTRVLPTLGRWVSRDGDAYEYLPRTVMAWPQPEAFQAEMELEGLVDCGFERLTGGIAGLHFGTVVGEPDGEAWE